jgi:tetratricopeptide (TPR) repeat protein
MISRSIFSNGVRTMIDNEREVSELVEALNRQLPMRAYATPRLAKAIRGQGGNVNVNDPVTIDSVLYLGDEGGIACALSHSRGKSVVVTSITDLAFDEDHPLFGKIRAYQSRRTQQLAGAAWSDSRRGRTGVATKRRRERGARKKSPQADLDRRFREGLRLWRLGKYARSADAFREVMERDPDDRRFARYYLASSLMQSDSSGELDELLQRYDDHSGIWRFAQALQAFRREGDREESQRLLVEADHLEPGFEGYLLRDKVVDAGRDVRFDAGDDERAFACARLFLPAWRGTPGAVSWARRVLNVPPASADREQSPRRFPQQQLRALPLRRETWQVGLMPCRETTDEDASPIWLFGVANAAAQELRAITVIDRPLTEAVVWDQLLPAFLDPADGEPARPETLVVCRREFRDAWKPLLATIGIGCRYKRDPQPVGQLLEAMSAVVRQPALPSVDEIDPREFPQTDAVWQADFFRSPAWVMNEREGAYRPWSTLVLDKSRSNALRIGHAPGDPAPEMLLEFLVQTMACPGDEEPQRPRLVEVSDSDCYDFVRPRLEAAGVACRLVDQLTEFNDFCAELARSMDGSEKCSLADGRGVTRAQLESFYEAAAYFFREAPWRRVPGEVPIEVRCDDPDMGTRYAIVLGRTGVQLGLCVYDDLAITQAILSGTATADENRALAVCYDEPQIMAAADLQLIDRFGWPIATPEAWPAVMRLQPGRSPQSPSAKELVFLDACLRAIPDFLKAKATSQHRQVETGTRSVRLHLG